MRIKRVLKVIGKFLLGIVVFVALYGLMAVLLPRIQVNSDAEQSDDVSIYILTNGVHTDVVLPIQNDVKDWTETVHFNNTNGKDSTANFVAFGWGDKGFYLETPTWADLKFSTAFKAATGLSESAMHVTFYKQMRVGEDCRKISISKANYEKLVEYIVAGFETDEAGNSIHVVTDANYGKNDAFYEGTGRYNLFFTCNTWANGALKSGNLKAAFWTPTDKGIFRHYP